MHLGFVPSQVRRKNKDAPNLGHPKQTLGFVGSQVRRKNKDANLGHPK